MGYACSREGVEVCVLKLQGAFRATRGAGPGLILVSPSSSSAAAGLTTSSPFSALVIDRESGFSAIRRRLESPEKMGGGEEVKT